MIRKYKEFTPEIGKDSWIAPNAEVIGMCEIGEDSSIWFGVNIRADVHYIKIGDRTNIQDGSVVHVTEFTKPDMSDGAPTIIGNDVTIGHNAMIHGCTIEDGCLIGMSATIIDGAIIGRESIVGAGSVVTKNKVFPPRSMIIGIPARRIRELTDEEVEGLYHSAQHYSDYKKNYQ
ncbi:MAG: gamma carbonic anhydrase family protein [Candidatus Cloacimonetes bacterium]|nr:gamma carbonic anhydrase family protein [Candidatus Cloacimonadota bacterium]